MSKPGTLVYSANFGRHFFEMLNIVVAETGEGDEVSVHQCELALKQCVGQPAFEQYGEELRRRLTALLKVLSDEGLIDVTTRYYDHPTRSVISTLRIGPEIRARELLFRQPRTKPMAEATVDLCVEIKEIMSRRGAPIVSFPDWVKALYGDVEDLERQRIQKPLVRYGLLEPVGEPLSGKVRPQMVPLSMAFRPLLAPEDNEGYVSSGQAPEFTRYAFVSFRACLLYHMVRNAMGNQYVFVSRNDLVGDWKRLTGQSDIRSRYRDELVAERLMTVRKVSGGAMYFRAEPLGTADLAPTTFRGVQHDHYKMILRRGIQALLTDPDCKDLDYYEDFGAESQSDVMEDDDDGDGVEDEETVGHETTGSVGTVDDQKVYVLPSRAYTLWAIVHLMQSELGVVTSARAKLAFTALTGTKKIHTDHTGTILSNGLLVRSGRRNAYTLKAVGRPDQMSVQTGTGCLGRNGLTFQVIQELLLAEGFLSGQRGLMASMPSVEQGIQDGLRAFYDWATGNLQALSVDDLREMRRRIAQARDNVDRSLMELDRSVEIILDLRDDSDD